MSIMGEKISVVTPTLGRPQLVLELIQNLSEQVLPVYELILVDGAPAGINDTQTIIETLDVEYPFLIRYFRQTGGTAIQRNYGIEKAEGDFIAFIDDDVRLKPLFFSEIIKVFSKDVNKEIGGITGYRVNKHFKLEEASRWRWYKRLRLLTTFEPGRYDYQTGYPINNFIQPAFKGVREVDFLTTSNTVWRKEVFENNLRFDEFFKGYGILEDAHLALRAKQKWKLLQCGDAESIELSSPGGREDRKMLGTKVVINYYYVFKSIAGPLSFNQKRRFFTYQAAELIRIFFNFLSKRDIRFGKELIGRFKGIYLCLTNKI
jgi:glycosyltransferase involved in cell wall biosynthesis